MVFLFGVRQRDGGDGDGLSTEIRDNPYFNRIVLLISVGKFVELELCISSFGLWFGKV